MLTFKILFYFDTLRDTFKDTLETNFNVFCAGGENCFCTFEGFLPDYANWQFEIFLKLSWFLEPFSKYPVDNVDDNEENRWIFFENP